MASLLQEFTAAQAEKNAEATALAAGEERFSYGWLEATSNQLARLLKDNGCRRGDRVCFLLPKSPAAIVAMLGILKADCIYVPLDPAGPAARLAAVATACDPRCILAAGATAKMLQGMLAALPPLVQPLIGWAENAPPEAEHIQARFSFADLASYSAAPLSYQNSGADAAHILFTSGSTGVPKGVVIKHANVTSFVDWAVSYFGFSHNDRIPSHTPLHFDLSTFDVYGTFAAGAELHLVPPALNLAPHKLAEFMRERALTQWFSVPAVLNLMAKFEVVRHGDFPALQRLMWCGEVFPTPSLRYWMRRLPHVSFTNLYGPTEATIASSYYTVPACPADDYARIPIGRACAGEELLVLGDDLRPVSHGAVGHLYLRGDGLSPGYWRDAAKTAAAFVPHPDGRGRVYRTGDLAQVGDDGLVYFLGRDDTQIKSRGYRIELGEIETALHALGILQDCAVVAVETDGFEGATICCAYVPAAGRPVSAAALRSAVSAQLPSYMLPARWLPLEKMPLNVNGKYDRRRLKESFMSRGDALK